MSGVFLAATGQHVGKTAVSLGVFSALAERLSTSYQKPVGQRWVTRQEPVHPSPCGGRSSPPPGAEYRTVRVDKDAALFSDVFRDSLRQDSLTDMSPVILPKGFTRSVLDGEVATDDLLARIKQSYSRLTGECVVVEGTGHSGVGSIIELNNAKVASELGLDAVLVAKGGLGSSFDEVALSYALMREHGVKLRGVVLNQVLPEKREMIMEYYTKALARWDVPLLGCIPFNPAIRAASVRDLTKLLNAKHLTAHQADLRTFSSTRLAVGFYDDATPFDPVPNQLVVTHATRLDVMSLMVKNHREAAEKGTDLNCGLIVTAASTLPDHVLADLEECGMPCIAVPAEEDSSLLSFQVLTAINNFTRKMDASDLPRLHASNEHIKKYIDIEAIMPSARSTAPAVDMEAISGLAMLKDLDSITRGSFRGTSQVSARRIPASPYTANRQTRIRPAPALQTPRQYA